MPPAAPTVQSVSNVAVVDSYDAQAESLIGLYKTECACSPSCLASGGISMAGLSPGLARIGSAPALCSAA